MRSTTGNLPGKRKRQEGLPCKTLHRLSGPGRRGNTLKDNRDEKKCVLGFMSLQKATAGLEIWIKLRVNGSS